MTKPKISDICDLCGNDIESETQYKMEAFQGNSFAEKRVRAQNKLDVCHGCWVNTICKTKYEPNFIAEQRNPNWVRGSKKVGERYYEPIPDKDPQTILEA